MCGIGVAAFLLCLGAAQAETLQHGNIIYTLPPNWETGRLEGGIQTVRSDLPDDLCEYCYIYLGTGETKRGSLLDYVARVAPKFVDEDDRDAVSVLQKPEITRIGPLSVGIMGQLVDGDPMFVLGYELSDRFEVAAFLGYSGYESEKLDESIGVFSDQVLPMLASLQFVSEGARSLMPDPVPGDLNGVYWGWYNATSLGLDGMVRLEVRHRRLVFWPDGYVFDGTPPSGLRPVDADAILATGDDRLGTYRRSGGTVTLTYATGRTEEISLNASGSLQDANSELFQVEPLGDGTILNGEISSFYYSGFTPGSGVEGGVSSSSATRFFPDGTYTGESFGGAFGNFVDGAGSLTGGFSTGGDGNATGGRYEIRDGLLIQYPADGSAPLASMVIKTSEGVMIDDQFLE